MTITSPAPLIDRDGYSRPYIKQPDGSVIPYTRTSVFAETLDNGYGIMLWKLRKLAIALGRYEDLAGVAAGLTEDRKKELDELIETALDRVGANAKALWGTAVHLFTEPDAPPHAPVRMHDDIAAYQEALRVKGLTVVATEQFVVNDGLRVAGSFDHIYHHPVWGRIVGDKKSGKEKYPAWPIQVATYANSYAYNIQTGERTPLDVNLDVGLIVHIPAGTGTCRIIPLDLRKGYKAAEIAADVREVQACDDWAISDYEAEHWPAMDNLQKGGLITDPITALIQAAVNEDILEGIWNSNRHAWTDEHTALAKAHRQKLTSRERVTA